MASIALVDSSPVQHDSAERRVIDATLRCISRWGVAKTTLDDVAREAGCSRATVYRLFPGGKDVLVQAVVVDEVTRFFAGLADRLAAADDLEDQLVAGITYAARQLAAHEALQYLLANEPEQVLPHVAFGRFDGVLASASGFVAPYLAPHVGEELAARTGEWVTRLVLSYTMAPSPTVDLTDDEGARRFARRYLLPGLSGGVSADIPLAATRPRP